MRTLMRLVVVSLLVYSAFVYGQDKSKALTNNDVIEMVRAGLPESTIVLSISQSPTKFDTSPSALIALNKAGVTGIVLNAMLNAGGSGYSESQPSPKDTPIKQGLNGEGDYALSQIVEPGIYVFENGKMITIEPTVFSGTKYNPLLGALTYGIKKTKVKAKVRGKAANIQVSSPQPVFYFVFNTEYKNSGAVMAGSSWLGLPATSPNEFMMVKMSTKDASREAIMGEYGTFSGMSTGARDEDVREYTFEKVKPGVYRVLPKSALTAGEYCFYYAAEVSGLGIGGGKIFDFGVKR